MRKIHLKRTMQWMGKDLVIHVQNENGHIGSVVIGQPYLKGGETHVTMNIWNQVGHKDDHVAAMYVKAAVLKFQCVVTCICGIHLEDICNSMEQVLFLSRQLFPQIPSARILFPYLQ